MLHVFYSYLFFKLYLLIYIYIIINRKNLLFLLYIFNDPHVYLQFFEALSILLNSLSGCILFLPTLLQDQCV